MFDPSNVLFVRNRTYSQSDEKVISQRITKVVFSLFTISLKTQTFRPITGTSVEVKQSPKSPGLWNVQNFMASHLKVAGDISTWTKVLDRHTGKQCHRATLCFLEALLQNKVSCHSIKHPSPLLIQHQKVFWDCKDYRLWHCNPKSTCIRTTFIQCLRVKQC